MVTGGNTGIGFETVKAFLESPKLYHILMGSRSSDKANAAIATLKEEVPNTKSTVEAVQVDLRSDESIQKAYQQVRSSYGKLDILINNVCNRSSNVLGRVQKHEGGPGKCRDCSITDCKSQRPRWP